MLIDWFTVGAQTLNFLILVWLLKRFLYQPILNAIDAREQRIARELASAQEMEMKAEQEQELFRQKNARFDQQRTELLKTAKVAANEQSQHLLKAARKEAKELISKRQATLDKQHQALLSAIMTRTRQEVFAITGQALSDLASLSLEAVMTEKLIAQLKKPLPEIEPVLNRLRSATGQLTISSAFPLNSQQQTALQDVLQQNTGNDIQVLFVTNPDLINGIELSVDGYKLGWNIKDYLRTFERRLNDLLATDHKTDTPVMVATNEEL